MLMASSIIDKRSPRLGRRAEHQSTDSRRRTRKKHASLIPEQLSLSSRYFLKRSKIDISRNVKFSFGTLNAHRRTWIVVSGLENPAKTPPGYDRITIFRAGSASKRYRARKIATPFRFVS